MLHTHYTLQITRYTLLATCHTILYVPFMLLLIVHYLVTHFTLLHLNGSSLPILLILASFVEDCPNVSPKMLEKLKLLFRVTYLIKFNNSKLSYYLLIVSMVSTLFKE